MILMTTMMMGHSPQYHLHRTVFASFYQGAGSISPFLKQKHLHTHACLIQKTLSQTVSVVSSIHIFCNDDFNAGETNIHQRISNVF